MPPDSYSALVISLVILCFIFGIGALVYQELYTIAKEELKHNAPWLYLNPSRRRNMLQHIKTNNITSKRFAMGRFARLGIWDKPSRILLKIASSSRDFIQKVITIARGNFAHTTLRILRVWKRHVNQKKGE